MLSFNYILLVLSVKAIFKIDMLKHVSLEIQQKTSKLQVLRYENMV